MRPILALGLCRAAWIPSRLPCPRLRRPVASGLGLAGRFTWLAGLFGLTVCRTGILVSAMGRVARRISRRTWVIFGLATRVGSGRILLTRRAIGRFTRFAARLFAHVLQNALKRIAILSAVVGHRLGIGCIRRRFAGSPLVPLSRRRPLSILALSIR